MHKQAILFLAFVLLATPFLAGAALAQGDPGLAALPAQVIGVVGSGEKLSLRIKAGEAVRTLNIGDAYQDGWTLTDLTDTTATLARNGQSQTVGLNPTGAVAQLKPDEPASTIKTVSSGLARAAALFEAAGARQPAFDQLLKTQMGPWDGKTPRLGLSLAETQRHVDYLNRGALDPATGQVQPQGPNGFLSREQVAALGADRADYLALNQKFLDALNAQRDFVDRPLSVDFPSVTGEPRPPTSPEDVLTRTQYFVEDNLSRAMISTSDLKNALSSQ